MSYRDLLCIMSALLASQDFANKERNIVCDNTEEDKVLNRAAARAKKILSIVDSGKL